MKKIILIIGLVAAIASCGKTNTVNTGSTNSNTAGSTAMTADKLSNFEGVYDIVQMGSEDCGASLRIVRECNGYRLMSNNRMGPEDFCNINGVRNDEDRVPPGPDRAPPSPDRAPPSPDRAPSAPVVTQVGNLLKSEVRITNNMTFTNTLTLNESGVLVKISNLKSRNSRCVYQKR